MSLLEDIQAAAIDPKSDLGTILRKCKLLAARLGSIPLEEWVLWETNGYPESVPVPDYRIWPVELKGHFSGYWGSSLQNAPIPLVCVPKEFRKRYQAHECRQSVASLEVAVNSTKSSLTLNTGDLNVILANNVFENMYCVQVWAEFPVGQVVELLNTVRNRVLDFSIALWKMSPAAGEIAGPGSEPIEPSQITQIFNTTVHDGGSATLLGASQHSSINVSTVHNDFDSLRKFLEDQGLAPQDVAELKAALAADGKPAKKDALGPKVSGWIGKMVCKAAEGSWKIGVGVAGKLLTDAILRHYGLS